jgi:hypothetical protein
MQELVVQVEVEMDQQVEVLPEYHFLLQHQELMQLVAVEVVLLDGELQFQVVRVDRVLLLSDIKLAQFKQESQKQLVVL